MVQYQSPTASAALVGRSVRVTKRLDPVGEVHAGGEFWAADAPDGKIAEIGDIVVVKGVEGLRLHVDFPPNQEKEEA